MVDLTAIQNSFHHGFIWLRRLGSYVRQTLYQTDLASLGAETLKQVMLDPDAPASAKVSAARTSLELAGDLSKNADGSIDGRQLAELTPDQLASMIDRWENERAELAKDITTAQKSDKT